MNLGIFSCSSFEAPLTYPLARRKKMRLIYAPEDTVFPETDNLLAYYEANIFQISEILKVSKDQIPMNIALCIEEGEGAAYNRDERKIIYKYRKGESLLKNKGQLIHEATHVVQDYSFKMIYGSALWVWAEGIADYCRLMLDTEFQNEMKISCNPEEGYIKAASFLVWLSREKQSIVPDLNKLIRDVGLELTGHDKIFSKLLSTSFNDLKYKCICENTNRGYRDRE